MSLVPRLPTWSPFYRFPRPLSPNSLCLALFPSSPLPLFPSSLSFPRFRRPFLLAYRVVATFPFAPGMMRACVLVGVGVFWLSFDGGLIMFGFPQLKERRETKKLLEMGQEKQRAISSVDCAEWVPNNERDSCLHCERCGLPPCRVAPSMCFCRPTGQERSASSHRWNLAET